MTITTLLTLLNKEDRKLTFVGQGRTFVFWENKFTQLPDKLDLGKQYIVKLNAKEQVDFLNSNIFLVSVEKADKVYGGEFEGKAKVSGTVVSLVSWNSNRNDYDLPFLTRQYETSKVTITTGKTNLVLYDFSKRDYVKGAKYSFLISLFNSKAYDDEGNVSKDEKYTFEGKNGEIVIKSFTEFKIIKATEIDGE